MNLSPADYKNILKFYGYANTALREMRPNEIKAKAEQLLATKLCRCIKAVSKSSPKNEARAIAICYNSVIQKKRFKATRTKNLRTKSNPLQMKTFRFKCDKGAKLFPKKGTRKVKVVKMGALPPHPPQ
jgi:hypothetical protein